jgi:dTDP-4-dehydrorhamnose reductase
LRPTVVINCAAYNHVDKAEAEPAAALSVNAWAVRDLALICRDLNCTLVHFSTNYVFGQETDRQQPYGEDDPPGPINRYGASKLEGEEMLRELWPKHFIVRTCGLYGATTGATGRVNFVDTILRKAAQREVLRVVNDQVCTPTAAADLAEAVGQLLTSEQYGLYHVTSGGACTWFEFAQRILATVQSDVRIMPISSHEYPLAAPRPRYSVLDQVRWLQQGFRPLRPWQEALDAYLRG